MGRYWIASRRGFPVSILGRFFVWRRIYGIQIGPWFFGAIKGDPAALNRTEVGGDR